MRNEALTFSRDKINFIYFEKNSQVVFNGNEKLSQNSAVMVLSRRIKLLFYTTQLRAYLSLSLSPLSLSSLKKSILWSPNGKQTHIPSIWAPKPKFLRWGLKREEKKGVSPPVRKVELFENFLVSPLMFTLWKVLAMKRKMNSHH